MDMEFCRTLVGFVHPAIIPKIFQRMSSFRASPSASRARPFENPENSKVRKLFDPTPVTIKDIDTKLGRTRVFWVRNGESNLSPLVILHGWAAGSGCFFKNVKLLAPNRPILLIDLPGFGESERVEFSDDPERDWIMTLKYIIEKEVGDEYWLSGHSFGAYLAGLLAIESDIRMKGVILLDAWGYPETTETFETQLAKLPWIARGLIRTLKRRKWIGLDPMRKCPDWMALPILKNLRSDLVRIYGDYFLEYTYELNQQKPASGEYAFDTLAKGFGFAKNPMEPRMLANLIKLPKQVHFIYGGESWVSSTSGVVISDALKIIGTTSSVTVVAGATHHLMCTHPYEFNTAMNSILD